MSPPAVIAAPIPRASLGDLVYERIVDGLLSGSFSSGDELNEATLATRFQVSRTPIREALRRLAAEGLVETAKNRQSTVVQLSRTDVIETYQVRQILESAAARLAAERIGDDQLGELNKLARSAVPRNGGAWGNDERLFDEQLHLAIAESCGNNRLRQEIARYVRLVRFVRVRTSHSSERLAQGHAEHVQILDALGARDAVQAESAMSAHLASALDCVLQLLPLS